MERIVERIVDIPVERIVYVEPAQQYITEPVYETRKRVVQVRAAPPGAPPGRAAGLVVVRLASRICGLLAALRRVRPAASALPSKASTFFTIRLYCLHWRCCRRCIGLFISA